MKRPVSYVVIAGTVLIGILSPFLLAKQYRLIDPNGRVILYATTNLEDVSSPTATAPSILPYCSREQVQQGFWTYNHTQPLRYRSTPWEETCYKNGNGYYPTQWNVDDSCQLVEWDPAILCEVLEHKTLGFIGDSISWQIFRSLKYLLNAEPTVERKVLEEFKCCQNTTIFWSRSNKLALEGVQQMMNQYQPDILVVNRGAWYDPDDVFFPQLQQVFPLFRTWLEQNDDHLLIWRTTAPSIPQCETFPVPYLYSEINSLPSLITAMEQHVESLPWYMADEKRKEFYWWKFRAQNVLVEDTLQQVLGTSFSQQLEFLDSYHWYIQQPGLRIGAVSTDGDCLHHCLPGVPDESSRLLLHLLQRRRSTLALLTTKKRQVIR